MRKIKTLLLTSLFVHLSTQTALADSNIEGNVTGFFRFTSIGAIISNIISVAITFAGVAMLLYLVLGGLTILTSGDDKTKVDSAHKHITNALIGLAVTASVWAIWKIAKAFFGLDTVFPE